MLPRSDILKLAESYRPGRRLSEMLGTEATAYHKRKVDALLADREKLVSRGRPRIEPGDTCDEIARIDEVWEVTQKELELLRRYVAEGYSLWDDA